MSEITIEEALKITGFVLCEFKWCGEEECCTCGVIQTKGEDVYYERTCHESDEGEYHCKDCVIETPSRWDEFGKDCADHAEKLGI